MTAFGRAIAQVPPEKIAAKAWAGWYIFVVRQEGGGGVHEMFAGGHWAVGVPRALERTFQSKGQEKLVVLGQGVALYWEREQSGHRPHTWAGSGVELENIDSMRLSLVVLVRTHVRCRSAGEPGNTS